MIVKYRLSNKHLIIIREGNSRIPIMDDNFQDVLKRISSIQKQFQNGWIIDERWIIAGRTR